jgi:hypothetical protein
VGTVRLVEVKAAASRLREIHAADRAALDEWLEASAALESASARHERVRLAAERERRGLPAGAAGRRSVGTEQTGAAVRRIYPVDPAARTTLIRRARAEAALMAAEPRRAAALAAGQAEIREAEARLNASARDFRAQVPWAESIVDLAPHGERRRGSLVVTDSPGR